MASSVESPKRTVAFAVDGFPLKCEHPVGLILIPMSVRIALRASDWDSGSVHRLPQLTYQENLDLQGTLDRQWQKMLIGNSDLVYHQYDFVWLISNLLLWRCLIRKTLQELRPASVLLPLRCQDNRSEVSSQGDLFTWALYQVLHEETLGMEPEYFLEGLSTYGSGSLRTISERLPGLLISRAIRVLRGVRMIVRRRAWRSRVMRRDLDAGAHKRWQFRLFGSGTKMVAVVIQSAKVEALLKVRVGRWRLRFVSYADFGKLFSPQGGKPVFRERFTGEMSSEEGLLEYFWWTVKNRRAACALISSAATADWEVFITDAQHDPYVRQFVDQAIAAGKHVAVVPEGAISYTGVLQRFGESALFITNPGITRFVLSEADRASWISRVVSPSQVMVSGFLGSSRVGGRLEYALQGRRLRKSISKMTHFTHQPTVLLSFDAFIWDWEIARFGSPSQSVLLEQLKRVLEVLLESGYLVLAKTRDPYLTREMTARFAGRPVLFTDSIPWTILAEHSSAVITRDSSIGWESLSLGKPVVVWNLSDYPSFAEVTLLGISGEWTKTVHDLTDLPNTIAELVKSNHGAKRSRGGSETPAPPVGPEIDVVRSWLDGLETVGGVRSGTGERNQDCLPT